MSTYQLLSIILGCGLITALVTGLKDLLMWRLKRKATKEDAEDDVNETLKKAIRLIMQDRIKYLGTKYLNDGHISIEDLRDIVAMHDFYHDELRGNGLLDYIMSDVKKLPKRS